jgi:para-nitrobenzyl esterase
MTVIVDTAQGRLAGFAKDGVLRFNGIPYAKPPVGALRWRAPEAPEPWAGMRDASRFGTIAPQVRSAAEAVIGGTPGEQSEDCLYLNVWTPSTEGRRPVMVWIHGGAFVTGAGTIGTYNGKHLASRGDVVVVTINYRLGAFGFLNLRDATDGKSEACGVEGLLDQIAALAWVKENIARFGGDPENVTVFGESAGAMSIGALLAMPQARGQFHKAILQSGAAHIGKRRESSAKIASHLLDALGIRDTRQLDAVPTEAILKIQAEIINERRNGGGLPFAPTVDGDLLPVRAIEAVRAGAAKGIALISGTTMEEWKLFTVARPKLRLMSAATLAKYTSNLVGRANTDAILAIYRDGSNFERWNAIMTDRSFAVPSARLLEAQSAHAPVHSYRFDWRSPLLGGVLGSCHALEIGFVFGTYNEKRAGLFFGNGPRADALSQAMMQRWIAFAQGREPWPRYDAAARATMMFGEGDPQLTNAPDDSRRAAWDTIPEDRIGP